MTISSTTTRAQYSGNGATTAFAVPFEFLTASGVKVIYTDADGVDATWVKDTHYTLTDNTVAATGTVNVKTTPTDYTPASGTKITILRNEPLTQAQSYTVGDPFPAKSHEKALDRLAMKIQMLEERLDRVATLKETSTYSGLTFPEPYAGKIVGWNAGGTDLENKTDTDLGVNVFPASASRYIRNNASGIPDVLSAADSTRLDAVAAAGIGTTSGTLKTQNADGGLSFDTTTTTQVFIPSYISGYTSAVASHVFRSEDQTVSAGNVQRVGVAFVRDVLGSGGFFVDTDYTVHIVANNDDKAGNATLNYDAQSANFTVGQTLTGGTSGATATISADTDSGATGTLTLTSISGTFEDNEAITDGSGGAAVANGTVKYGLVQLGELGALRMVTFAGNSGDKDIIIGTVYKQQGDGTSNEGACLAFEMGARITTDAQHLTSINHHQILGAFVPNPASAWGAETSIGFYSGKHKGDGYAHFLGVDDDTSNGLTDMTLGIGLFSVRNANKYYFTVTAENGTITSRWEDSGSLGASWRRFKDSSSPAASDVIWNDYWRFRNSSAAQIDGILVQGVIVDPTASSEDTSLRTSTYVAGALTEQFRVQNGLSTGGLATQGTGTLNLGGALLVGSTAVIDTNRHFRLRSYTVATLPTATVQQMIYVSDETGGAIPAFADGTNWRRVTDRAIVS